MTENKKTYKRELAVVLLLWLGYLVEFKEPGLVEIVIFPLFAYVMGAFGLDAYAKQLHGKSPQPADRRRPQGSGKRPSGEDKQPDSGAKHGK